MKKLIALAALLLAPLAGCQAAPVAAPVASLSAERPVAGPAPRIMTGAQVRRLLAADAGATLWGLNYSKTDYRQWGRSNNRNWTVSSHGFAGRGELVKADVNRFVYQVPDDQMLVINKVQGGLNKGSDYQGTISLNGFGAAIYDTDVHYVFGPGELVVLHMHPLQSYAYNGDRSGYTNFHGLAISGYTASPALLSQAGGTRATK